MNPANGTMASLRWRTRTALGNHRLSFPVIRYLPGVESDGMVGPDSTVCLEGYPRSGNSFAFRAFQRWNPEAVIAHHMHLPMQVPAALRLDVPTAVLIREPEGAIPSLYVFFEGRVTVSVLLDTYLKFHLPLVDLRDRIAVCGFADFIREPAMIPVALNEKFGTDFDSHSWTEVDETAVREEMASHHRDARTGLAARMPLPSAEKDAAKSAILSELRGLPRLRSAKEIYRRFTA